MTPPSGPLAGIRVLDLTRLLPGAFATALLGRPRRRRDQDRAARHRRPDARLRAEDRRSVGLHVGDRPQQALGRARTCARTREALLALVETADALVESFRPGVMDRLGLGYEALARVNPKLVYVLDQRLRRRRPARPGGRPRHQLHRARRRAERTEPAPGRSPSVQIADLAGGSLLGVAGLLAALVRAQRTGEGDHVDIAMTDGAFALQALGPRRDFATARPRASSGAAQRPLPVLRALRVRRRAPPDGRRARAAVLARAVRGRRAARPVPTQFDPRRARRGASCS